MSDTRADDVSDDGIEDSFGAFESDSLLQQQQQQQQGATINSHRRSHSDLSFFIAPKKKRGGHHRRQSSVSRLIDSVSVGLGTIVEDVKFAAGDVKQSFLDDLHDAQDGRMFFMDTTMTRTLSLRPDDFVDFVEETTGRIDTHPPTFPPILALLAAVFAISSHGTALTLQHGVAPALKLYWRMSAVAALLFLVVIVRQSSFPRLNTGQWTTVVVAITCFTVQNLCFVTALSKTTIGNTVIFANSQAVLLLMGKILTGSHVVCMEGIGALVASSGAIVCASSEHNDHDDKDDNGDKAKALLGDFYALASAFCGVGYLTFAKSARSTTSVTMFTFLMMFGGSFLILFYIILVGEQFTWSMNPTHGLFGWMELSADRLGVELWIVLVCNLVGTMGFVRSLQYFDSIIIAVATLLEPMLASIIAFSMGVGELPGLQGWIGNLLVALGTLAVVYPSIDNSSTTSSSSAEDAGGGH